jgi:hypothetical protein
MTIRPGMIISLGLAELGRCEREVAERQVIPKFNGGDHPVCRPITSLSSIKVGGGPTG